MVQVDLLLAFGLGAGFAVLDEAGRRGADTAPPADRQDGDGHGSSSAFPAALLYLGILFVPSGLWLLARFPSWETMHVLPRPPAWFAAAFAAACLAAGATGFACAAQLLRRGYAWAGAAQMLWPHVVLCAVVIHGWDGTGMTRFLTPFPGELDSGVSLVERAGDWVVSPLAVHLGTLLLLNIITFAALWSRQYRVAARRGGAPVRGVAAHRQAAIAVCWLLGPCVVIGSLAGCAPLLLGAPGWILTAAVTMLPARPGGFFAQAAVRTLLPVDSGPSAPRDTVGRTRRALPDSGGQTGSAREPLPDPWDPLPDEH
ncbi:hypothetical protein [Streptomyces enissocaesilis]|uniref:Uncharacterized protein n=1 Tax=Streptomyces enissocaesilis TaxID=332589 RepID=A0ABN3XNN7_9ACTN